MSRKENLADLFLVLPAQIKCVDSCWIFSTKWSDTVRIFLNMERSKNHEQKYHNRAKKSTSLRGFDCRKTVFGISRNIIRKLHMTLSARKSCADSFLKIKTDDNRVRFREINKTVKNSTAKLRNSNL